MRLSIIIPVYNAASYLRECLLSIVNSNVHQDDYEIIAVNDGSTDQSLEILRSFQSEFKNFKCFTQDNKGVSKTRNFALDHAEGEYIFFLDADDHFKEGALNHLIDVLNSNPSFDVLLTDPTYSDELKYFTTDELLSNVYFSVYLWKDCFRNEFLQKHHVRFIEDYILEDGIFVLQSILLADAVATLSLDLVNYVENPKSYMRDTTNAQKNNLMIDSFVYVIQVYETYIQDYQSKFSHKAIQNLVLRKESFVFFLISRMILLNYGNKNIEERLNQVQFTTFKEFPGPFYVSYKYKLVSKVFEIKLLRRLAVLLYKLKKSC